MNILWEDISIKLLRKITGQLSPQDWMRKFYRTYVRIPVDNKIVVAMSYELGYDVDSEGIVVKCLGDTSRYILPYEQVDWTIPTLGMVASKYGLVYVDRRIQRQWKEALCDEWIAITKFMARQSDNHKPLSTRRLVTALHDNQYEEVSTIIHKIINREAVAGVLNEHWGIFISESFTDIMLAYKTHVVGTVDVSGTLELYSYAAHLYEYLFETVNPFNVIVKENMHGTQCNRYIPVAS